MDPVLGGIFGGGGNLLGGIIGNMFGQENQRRNNDFNYMLQQQNQMWNLQLDNTKYQRGVADMRAAGLNPAMMYGAGGGMAANTTPTSPGYSSQPAQYRDPVGPAVESAIRALSAISTVSQQNEQNALISNQSAESIARAEKTKTESDVLKKRAGLIPDEQELIRSQQRREASTARQLDELSKTYPSQVKRTEAETESTNVHTKHFQQFGHDNLWQPGTIGRGLDHSYHQTAKTLGIVGDMLQKQFVPGLKRALHIGEVKNPEYRNGRIGSPLFGPDAMELMGP